jgi:diguanylate cyclase (GGDEF)-like protein
MADEKNSVLIVDDDNANLMVLFHILQQEYTVYTAKDGASAISKAERLAPDLILLDILMPGKDGYEVFAELKKSEKAGSVPIIFITGLSDLDNEKRGLELGAVDYINKPFDAMIVKLRVALHMRLINQLRTIEYLSTTDQLTKLPNRRAFDNRLATEWGRAVREREPLTMMMADADHFKLYNDRYGHQQGDKALQRIADILREAATRSTDFTARWGGEEFVVLLSNTDEQAGLAIAEKIRAGVEASEIPLYDGSATRITVSIGLITRTPGRGSFMEEFVTGADKALYAAKEAGRNRVMVYGADTETKDVGAIER